jgi:3-deoxy-7-phosphoheptulonate synthase
VNCVLGHPLITIEEIKKQFPIYDTYSRLAKNERIEIKSILDGKSKKLLVIVGPCSAWPVDAVIDYAKKLASLNKEIHAVIKIVMRVYTQKPRTTIGWKGTGNQPDISKKADINQGILKSIEMMLAIINLGLPIADELLHSYQIDLFSNLLSWVAIGARSSQCQEHRILASMLDIPVGMKNPIHGPVSMSLENIISARYPHTAAYNGYQVETLGNPYAHIVLRGANNEPNYTFRYLNELTLNANNLGFNSLPVLIDASHDNSIKDGKRSYLQQIDVVLNILNMLDRFPYLNKFIKGFMLESFMQEGSQKIQNSNAANLSGLSITDPCLSWEQTESLLLEVTSLMENKLLV